MNDEEEMLEKYKKIFPILFGEKVKLCLRNKKKYSGILVRMEPFALTLAKKRLFRKPKIIEIMSAHIITLERSSNVKYSEIRNHSLELADNVLDLEKVAEFNTVVEDSDVKSEDNMFR